MDCAVRSFCGFFSLQTGTTAVGSLSLARGALGLSQAYRNMDLNVDPADNDITKMSIAEIKAILTMPISWIILSIVTIGVTIPLLITAWRNHNAALLLPWLVLEPFLTFTGIGFTSHDFILSLLAGQNPIDSASSIGAIVLVAAVDIYSCLVVYYYYRQLRRTHENRLKPGDKIQIVLHEDHSSDRHFSEKTPPYQSTEPLIPHNKT